MLLTAQYEALCSLQQRDEIMQRFAIFVNFFFYCSASFETPCTPRLRHAAFQREANYSKGFCVSQELFICMLLLPGNVFTKTISRVPSLWNAMWTGRNRAMTSAFVIAC